MTTDKKEDGLSRISAKLKALARKAKAFLPPQSDREKKLVISYSAITVVITSLIAAWIPNKDAGLFGNQSNESRALYKVNTVITYPGMIYYQRQNNQDCAQLDQSTEYDQLIAEGWKITSTQAENRTVPSTGTALGECQGTLYILNK